VNKCAQVAHAIAQHALVDDATTEAEVRTAMTASQCILFAYLSAIFISCMLLFWLSSLAQVSAVEASKSESQMLLVTLIHQLSQFY